MRLIDADALFNWGKYKLSDAVKYGNKDGEQQAFSYSRMMMYEIADEIDDAPTIDAVPVMCGEWVVDECDTTDDVPSFAWIDFHCSECSTDYGLEEGQYGWCRYEKIPYQYCPHCGAKMGDKL